MALKFSSLLVRDNVISIEKMEEALQRQVIFGGRLGTNLLEMGVVSEEELTHYLALARDLRPATAQSLGALDKDALALLDVNTIEHLGALPIRLYPDGRAEAVVLDGLGFDQMEQLRGRTGYRFEQLSIPEFRFRQIMMRIFDRPYSRRVARLVERFPMEIALGEASSLGARKPAEEATAGGKPNRALKKDELGRGWTLEEIADYLQDCYIRDVILSVVLGFASNYAPRRMLLVVLRHRLQGYSAAGENVPDDQLKRLRLKIHPDGAIERVCKGDTYYQGPPEEGELHSLYKALSLDAPSNCLLMPIPVGPRAALVLLMDCGDEIFEVDALEPLFIVINEASEALERIIRLTKTGELPPEELRTPPLPERFRNGPPPELRTESGTLELPSTSIKAAAAAKRAKEEEDDFGPDQLADAVAEAVATSTDRINAESVDQDAPEEDEQTKPDEESDSTRRATLVEVPRLAASNMLNLDSKPGIQKISPGWELPDLFIEGLDLPASEDTFEPSSADSDNPESLDTPENDDEDEVITGPDDSEAFLANFPGEEGDESDESIVEASEDDLDDAQNPIRELPPEHEDSIDEEALRGDVITNIEPKTVKTAAGTSALIFDYGDEPQLESEEEESDASEAPPEDTDDEAPEPAIEKAPEEPAEEPEPEQEEENADAEEAPEEVAEETSEEEVAEVSEEPEAAVEEEPEVVEEAPEEPEAEEVVEEEPEENVDETPEVTPEPVSEAVEEPEEAQAEPEEAEAQEEPEPIVEAAPEEAPEEVEEPAEEAEVVAEEPQEEPIEEAHEDTDAEPEEESSEEEPEEAVEEPEAIEEAPEEPEEEPEATPEPVAELPAEPEEAPKEEPEQEEAEEVVEETPEAPEEPEEPEEVEEEPEAEEEPVQIAALSEEIDEEPFNEPTSEDELALWPDPPNILNPEEERYKAPEAVEDTPEEIEEEAEEAPEEEAPIAAVAELDAPTPSQVPALEALPEDGDSLETHGPLSNPPDVASVVEAIDLSEFVDHFDEPLPPPSVDESLLPDEAIEGGVLELPLSAFEMLGSDDDGDDGDTVLIDTAAIELELIDEDVPEVEPMLAPETERALLDWRAVVERVCGNDQNDARRAAAKLAASQGEALPAMLERFPGKLLVDRYGYGAGHQPPVSEHSHLMRALVEMGDLVAPALASLTTVSSVEVRFYATFFFSKVIYEPAIPALIEVLFEKDGLNRETARHILRGYSKTRDYNTVLTRVRKELRVGDSWYQEQAAHAAGAFTDSRTVPLLIDLISSPHKRVSDVAQRALRTITYQDFGNSARKWSKWWSKNAAQPRHAWLVEALGHGQREIRQLAASELRSLPGLIVNYSPDASRRERSRAQKVVTQYFRERS